MIKVRKTDEHAVRVTRFLDFDGLAKSVRDSEQSAEQTRLLLIIDALAQQDAKYSASEKKEKKTVDKESTDYRTEKRASKLSANWPANGPRPFLPQIGLVPTDCARLCVENVFLEPHI